MLETIIAGIVNGVGWGVLGLFKNSQIKPDFKISPVYFLRSVFVGGVLGAVVSFSGNLSPESLDAAFADPVMGAFVVGGANEILRGLEGFAEKYLKITINVFSE